MYQKDYVLFLIEQFARILRAIIAKISGGEYDSAEFEIEQVYRQYLGLNSDLIHAFSYRYLMQLQNADPEHYVDRCVVLAELLRMDSLLYQKRGQPKQAFLRGVKSLQVFLELYREHPGKAAEHAGTIKELHRNVEEILKLSDADGPLYANVEIPPDIIRAVEQIPDDSATRGSGPLGPGRVQS